MSGETTEKERILMSIIINDKDKCKCGAYWQGNGFCCNGHTRQQTISDRELIICSTEFPTEIVVRMTENHITLIMDNGQNDDILMLTHAEFQMIAKKFQQYMDDADLLSLGEEGYCTPEIESAFNRSRERTDPDKKTPLVEKVETQTVPETPLPKCKHAVFQHILHNDTKVCTACGYQLGEPTFIKPEKHLGREVMETGNVTYPDGTKQKMTDFLEGKEPNCDSNAESCSSCGDIICTHGEKGTGRFYKREFETAMCGCCMVETKQIVIIEKDIGKFVTGIYLMCPQCDGTNYLKRDD